ncbi:hypothetical protein TNCV_2519021 [Trichonephila clavipes]|nr:hypothetical protein TNCV_2519021 [Trichonephila clavipes]
MVILNLRNGSRRRAVVEFRLATGHDCLRNHLYRPCTLQLWRGHGLRTSSTPGESNPNNLVGHFGKTL